jgi:4'-phosphopantetheinyl transferase EntD
MSDETVDPALSIALSSIAPTGVLIGHRLIRAGDEHALLAAERDSFHPSALKIYRQSGAARIVARRLLRVLGLNAIALPRSASGAPVWPAGVVGSLAHDKEVAVAAIAKSDEFSALGIDVEPVIPLPPELVRLITTPAEQRRYPSAVIESPLLFVIKEAIYKALNPHDGVFLDFQDIEVDLSTHRGRTRTGETVEIAFTPSPRFVAISFRYSSVMPTLCRRNIKVTSAR